MHLKTNLHLHTSDDPHDFIRYSFYDAIDEAERLGFDAIALTCHGFFATKPEYEEYAQSKNIVLIPGAELALDGSSRFTGRHVVVLNCEKDIEKVETLDELREYKKNNPLAFVLAPHPYYSHPFGKISLFEKLKKNIDIFDAIENSWFYSKWVKGPNKKAEKLAKKNNLPFISTSDTHHLEYIETSYAVVDAKERTAGSILQAIKENNFYNVSTPRKFWKEMVGDFVLKKTIINGLIKRILLGIKN